MGRDPDEIVRVIHSDMHLLRKQFAALDTSSYATAPNKSTAESTNTQACSAIESPKRTKHSQLEVLDMRVS